jgi:hypothetical protein
MKIIPLIVLLLSVSTTLFSQNLIGFKESEIREYMKENRKDMNYTASINSRFKYLKYSDDQDNQTILFFFKNNLICHSERMICDYSIKTEKIKEFNSQYKKTGDNKWIDSHGGQNYTITLTEEQWSFIVTIEQAK